MAHRTLSRLMLTAFGVSLLAGAGQLGLAFGFGIIRLTGTFTGVIGNQWPAQLVWVGWFATNAVVVAAVLTERLARGGGQLTGIGRQLAVAGSAALGATVVAPLCMQPARGAEVSSVDPVWSVAVCAALGALIGTGAALAVLTRPPFAWNMVALAGVMWLVALLSVIPSLGASGPLTPVRLGVLEPAWLATDTREQLALLLLPTLTLLAGLTTGSLARSYGFPPLLSGASGAAGPLLVAFAYLAAGPGGPGERYQLWPYYGALIAVAVGTLGSAAAALLPWWAQRLPATEAIEPTAILPPLPAAPALPGAGDRRTGAESAASSAVVGSGPGTAAGGGDMPTPTGGDGSRSAASEGRTADPPPHWHWPTDRTVGDGGVLPARGPAPEHTPTGGTDEAAPAQATPAPRHRPPMPDLTGATTWSFTPTRQQPATPPVADGDVPPLDAGQPTTVPEEPPSAAPAPRDATDPATAVRDLTAAFTRPPVVRAEEVQPSSENPDQVGRRGLFRRGRSRSEATGTAAEREEPLAAQDEEYVHWVTELSRPISDDEPAPKKSRRSLRSNGRHHRDGRRQGPPEQR